MAFCRDQSEILLTEKEKKTLRDNTRKGQLQSPNLFDLANNSSFKVKIHFCWERKLSLQVRYAHRSSFGCLPSRPPLSIS